MLVIKHSVPEEMEDIGKCSPLDTCLRGNTRMQNDGIKMTTTTILDYPQYNVKSNPMV